MGHQPVSTILNQSQKVWHQALSGTEEGLIGQMSAMCGRRPVACEGVSILWAQVPGGAQPDHDPAHAIGIGCGLLMIVGFVGLLHSCVTSDDVDVSAEATMTSLERAQKNVADLDEQFKRATTTCKDGPPRHDLMGRSPWRKWTSRWPKALTTSRPSKSSGSGPRSARKWAWHQARWMDGATSISPGLR